jgi:hypothetical protein
MSNRTFLGLCTLVNVLYLSIVFSCGPEDDVASKAESSYRRPELQHLAAIHRQGWDNYNGTIVWNDGNPAYPQNQGNANLFHGLLCYSGDDDSCRLVETLRCSTGHIKRAPWRVCGDESRDEYIGQALTALRTRSVFALPGSYPFLVTPTFARTMQLAGFNIKGTPDHPALLLQAKTVPVTYQLHLVAVQAWIRRDTEPDTQALKLVFVELRNRHPRNLFYKYLRGGATRDLIDEFLAWAPPAPVARQSRWPWQDPPSEYSAANAHSASIVFLANLLAR